MDIFNRAPSIAEDTLSFSIYPVDTALASVTALRTLIVDFVDHELLPPNHIWHRDSLHFDVVSGASDSHLASDDSPQPGTRIEGTMRVGDAVDDEWLVVWLLFEISRKWDVIVSVSDSDGEFLLIEAAEHLLSWVTPDNVENRVWIYQAHLHLVPLDQVSPSHNIPHRRRRQSGLSDDEEPSISTSYEQEEQWISPKQALQTVRDPSVPTVAVQGVQSAIQRKISRYPAAAHQHVHKTNAYIPSDVALALSQNRALIQKAVEAFYTRDALQLRAASKMTRFPPNTSILTSVGMTRTSYAQLSGQRFHPPKVFGREWLPTKEGTDEWRWRDIGMKIACGFEMLYAETKSSSSKSGLNNVDATSSLVRSPSYDQYLANLQRGGWFDGEIQGSEKWKERQRKADEGWEEAKDSEKQRENGQAAHRNQRATFTALVDEAIGLAAPRRDIIISGSASTLEEDSDEWLNVSSIDLENTLAASLPAKVTKSRVDTEGEDETAEATEKLSRLAQKVDRFVMDPEERGGLEGARFDDDDGDSLFSDDEDKEDGTSSSSDSDEDHKHSAAKRQEAMDALVPPLDPNDYGKLPPPPSQDTVYPDDIDMDVDDTQQAEGRLPKSKAKLEPIQIRKPIFVRDKFDGVDSDDETSSEEDGTPQDEAAKRRALLESLRDDEGVVDADDEAFPQVVDGAPDIEVDMEAEQEAFLKFSREQLGINEDMWKGILDERRGRGAFAPPSTGPATNDVEGEDAAQAQPETWFKPADGAGKQKRARFLDAISGPDAGTAPSASVTMEEEADVPKSVPRTRNPNLDSFEAVMEAMDVELQNARSKRKQGKEPKDNQPPIPRSGTTTTLAKGDKVAPPKADRKGKGKQAYISSDEDDEEEDDPSSAVDAELRAALRKGSGDESDEEEVEEAAMDYNLIKNFLESFKSQAGMAGPVSTLAGRLEKGWTLPRDES